MIPECVFLRRPFLEHPRHQKRCRNLAAVSILCPPSEHWRSCFDPVQTQEVGYNPVIEALVTPDVWETALKMAASLAADEVIVGNAK